MTFETLKDVLIFELDDLYSAEKQIVKALPKMAEASMSEKLSGAFLDHLKQSEEHISRLDEVAEILGITLGKAECKGMEGLLKEGGALTRKDPNTVLDAALISAAQRVEHYEIAGYGSARTFATLLGYNDVADILQETLDEEKDADELLTEITESEVNPESVG